MKKLGSAGAVLVLAVLVLAATFAGTARAGTQTVYWSDGSTSNAGGGCSPITANGGMPYRWYLDARDFGSYYSPYGDAFSGFPSSYIKFYVYDFQQRRYVFADTTWRLIPKGVQGLSFTNMTWSWGTGSFWLGAMLWHNGQTTNGIVEIGRVTWQNSNGVMLCFNL